MTKAEYATNERMVKKMTLDFYGSELLCVGFQYAPDCNPYAIVKISNKYTTGVFEGKFSLN